MWFNTKQHAKAQKSIVQPSIFISLAFNGNTRPGARGVPTKERYSDYLMDVCSNVFTICEITGYAKKNYTPASPKSLDFSIPMCKIWSFITKKQTNKTKSTCTLKSASEIHVIQY